MPVITEDYQKYVIDDLEQYKGLRKSLSASLRERMLIKKRPPQMLHPNPEDEFSQINIGPNYEIIQKYVVQFRRNLALGIPMMEEPLMVEKMSPDGYLILNGHHRWFASLRIQAKNVPIQIVNLVHAKELKQMIHTAKNDKRAVFDLDEVLFVMDDGQDTTPAEPSHRLLHLDKVFQKKLRLHAPVLLQELQKMGYDIWIYTAGYHSAKSIYAYFKLYHVEVQGIINGAGRHRNTSQKDMSSIKKVMNKQYHETIHIDTDHVLRICPGSNDYDYITLQSHNDNWASKVVNTVRSFQ